MLNEPARQARLEELYDRALAQPEAIRDTWLRSACPDDPRLCDDVVALLGYAATLPDGSPAGSPVPPGPRERHVTDPTAIGPYRIIRRLGEGSFGVVYEVEQRVPLRRRLALKLLKAGMDTEEVLARFATERRALAMLDHPNIARVIDAGAAPSGRPYFVMELVNGEPLTQFCDDLRLTVRERLDLLLAVCRAVRSAHQRGVLHRDLKPSNILVALVDGRPLVKIIDFGIAKVTTPEADASTPATMVGEAVGTPAYMSPEQASNSRLGVDTATDVYSLGVIMYELLCGRLPRDPVIFRGRAPTEFERLLRESRVVAPSARLRPVDDEVLRIAQARGTDPWHLHASLRGDLDWIAMRAIEPDRLHRYQSTQDLMQELERHFADQPVAAGPPAAGYRLRKFVRRHRRGLSMASVFVVALIVAAGALTYSLLVAQRERAAAVAAQAEAESVLDFLSSMLGAARPSNEGRDVTVVEVLQQASTDIATRFAQRPRVAARMHHVIGRVQRDLGRYDDATAHVERALALHRDLLLPTGAVLQDLGYLQREKGDYAAAESTFSQLLRDYRRQAPRPDARIVETLVDLAGVAMMHENPALGLDALEEAQAMVNAGTAITDDLRSAILSYLGALLNDRGEFARAEPLLREALRLDRMRLGERHPNVIAHMQTLGAILRESGRPDDAVPLLRDSWELARAVYGEDHPVTLSGRNNLAVSLNAAGAHDEAHGHAAAVVDTRMDLLGRDHPATLIAMVNLAGIQLRRGEHEAAAVMARDALERIVPVLGVDHRHATIAHGRLGEALLAGGDAEAAQPHLAAAAAAYRASEVPATWALGRALCLLGTCQARLGRHAEAESSLTEAHRVLVATVGGDDERTREAVAALAELYGRMGRPELAARWRP